MASGLRRSASRVWAPPIERSSDFRTAKPFRWKYANPAQRITHGGTFFKDSPLVRREPVPTGGFPVVLRNTSAVVVHDAKTELGGGVALISREPVRANGFAVLRNTPAAVEHEAEVKLRAGIPLIRCESVPADGFAVVLRNTPAAGVH